MGQLESANQNLLFSVVDGDGPGVGTALALGADPDPDAKDKDNLGWTASMLAAHHGHLACLGLLASAGADLDAKEKHGGRTATMIAAADGHAPCLGLLIAAGVDADAKDRYGWTAAMFSAARGQGGLPPLAHRRWD